LLGVRQHAVFELEEHRVRGELLGLAEEALCLGELVMGNILLVQQLGAKSIPIENIFI
jgi:hypothetical protein